MVPGVSTGTDTFTGSEPNFSLLHSGRSEPATGAVIQRTSSGPRLDLKDPNGSAELLANETGPVRLS